MSVLVDIFFLVDLFFLIDFLHEAALKVVTLPAYLNDLLTLNLKGLT